jgi:hypothetical protein
MLPLDVFMVTSKNFELFHHSTQVPSKWPTTIGAYLWMDFPQGEDIPW